MVLSWFVSSFFFFWWCHGFELDHGSTFVNDQYICNSIVKKNKWINKNYMYQCLFKQEKRELHTLKKKVSSFAVLQITG